jgi:lipopolysaccharide heptosyltransferase II
METLKNTIKRILVIQTAFLGDAILTLPMIMRLKQKFPKSIIDVLAIQSTEAVFVASPDVDNVYVIDKRGKHKGFKGMNNFIKQLRSNLYSTVYSPHRSVRSAYITFKLGTEDSFAFDNSSLRYAYKNIVKYEAKHHEVHRNLALIGEDVKEKEWKILPQIDFLEEEVKNVTRTLSLNSIEEKFIAVAPGSVWETKRYPKEYFIELINKMMSIHKKVVLIGGNDDKILCEEIVSHFDKKVINLAGMLTVTETIYLLKFSQLLITNDSAPTHMGMCADIPVLTIYCSTVPEFGFYPYNDKSKFISYNELQCKPCGIHGYHKCPIKTFDCGKKLLPENVFKLVEKMIGEKTKNG